MQIQTSCLENRNILWENIRFLVYLTAIMNLEGKKVLYLLRIKILDCSFVFLTRVERTYCIGKPLTQRT